MGYSIQGKGKGWISIVILVFCFLGAVFQRQNTGYIFNYNKLSDLNVLLQLVGVVLPFVMFVIANWVVAMLMNGIGRFRDIWIYSSYCLVPYVLGTFISVLLSNVLVKEEPFAQYVQTAGIAWSIVVLFIGLMVMHQFSFSQNVLGCLATIFIMAVLMFLLMLVASLGTDLYGFIMTISKEIFFRIS